MYLHFSLSHNVTKIIYWAFKQLESQEILLYDHRLLRSSTLTRSPRSDYTTSDYASISCASNDHSATVGVREEVEWIRKQLSEKEDELVSTHFANQFRKDKVSKF
jgi:hypothetical protein